MKKKWIGLALVFFSLKIYADPCADDSKIWTGWWTNGSNPRNFATTTVKISNGNMIVNVGLNTDAHYYLGGKCIGDTVQLTGLTGMEDPHPLIHLSGSINEKNMMLNGDITTKSVDGHYVKNPLTVQLDKGPFLKNTADDCSNFAGNRWGGHWDDAPGQTHWAFGNNRVEGDKFFIDLTLDQPKAPATRFFQGTCKNGNLVLDEPSTKTHLEGYIVKDDIWVIGTSNGKDAQLAMENLP